MYAGYIFHKAKRDPSLHIHAHTYMLRTQRVKKSESKSERENDKRDEFVVVSKSSGGSSGG